MKKIDAVWEKRNLGVSTVEVSFDEKDTIQEIKECLKNLKDEYVVLKIPSHRPDILPLVHELGYQYIEDMVYISSDLQEINRTPLEQRFYDAVSVEAMNEKDMKVLEEEIRKGLFDSDRIYLDPYFSHEIAQQRYVNWVKDEYERGTLFFKYIYKNETIGFFGLREVENGHYTSFLGGIYLNYRKGGIGTVVKVPDTVKKLGGKKVSTSVSTNNVVQIKSLIKNGYIPESISHTFIKHF